MTVHVDADHAAATARATGIVVAAIGSATRVVLGLPTGRTPIDLYRSLVAHGLDWSRVATFNLDEFVSLAPDHPSSFRAFMETHLFSQVTRAPAAINFLRGDAADLEAECARYDQALAEAGGLDLLVLGLGANGHVGFNEPAETLVAATHVVTLEASTRRANAHRFAGDWRHVPEQALTIGMRAVLSARQVLVIATGVGKAEAVAAMLDGPLTTRAPASWLQTHPRVDIVVDRAAAGDVVRRAAAAPVRPA